jgi:nicotinamidase-related amidase
MIRPILTLRRKRVVIDVDTQKDLFLAEGSACIRNHRRVLANLRRVMAWARRRNIRVISTKIEYIEPQNDKNSCIPPAGGTEKISYTTRHKSISFPADGSTDLQREILKNYDQVVLEKRCPDPFKEPRIDRIFCELRADEFIVVGALMEQAVKATVLGLLARRKNVTLLVDAVGYHNKNAADIALRQMEAKGAKIAEIKNLVGSSGLKLVGACHCDRCRGKLQKTGSE